MPADPLEVTQEMREAFFHAWGEWAYGPRQQGAQREMFAFAAGLAASPAAARIELLEREVAEYRMAADAEAEEVDRLGRLVRRDREALDALRAVLAGEDAEAVERVASALVRVGGAHDYWPVGLVREKTIVPTAALPVLERLRERADDLPGHMASVQRDGRQGPRVFWVDSDDVLALINEAIEEHR